MCSGLVRSCTKICASQLVFTLNTTKDVWVRTGFTFFVFRPPTETKFVTNLKIPGNIREKPTYVNRTCPIFTIESLLIRMTDTPVTILLKSRFLNQSNDVLKWSMISTVALYSSHFVPP